MFFTIFLLQYLYSNRLPVHQRGYCSTKHVQEEKAGSGPGREMAWAERIQAGRALLELIHHRTETGRVTK